MEALISADASMKQASVHGGTAKKMEGKANVLEMEIQLDSSRGGDTGLKKEELAKTKAVAEQATASQMESLAQAGKTMQEAAENERKDGNVKSGEEDRKQAGVVAEEDEKTEGIMAKEDDSMKNTFDVEIPGVPFSRGYNPVDIKL